MILTALLTGRRLLQAAEVEKVSETSSLSSTAVAGDPTFQAMNASLTTALRRTFSPNSHLDSSMALTILILLTAFFFMGFFSVCIRRSTAAEHHSPPSPTSISRRPPRRPNHKGGLDPSAVNSLPLVAYGRAAKRQMIDDCAICLSEFREREIVKLIPYCGHVFHSKCVDTWLASHVTCPLCRCSQLFKRVEEG